MEINLISETLKFLVLGMSTVFMFLILMVLVVELQSKIIIKYFPPKQEVPDAYADSSVSKKDNLAIIAAIAASLQLHQQTK